MSSFPKYELGLPNSLRGKTLLIILITVFGLVGGLYTLARIVLLRGYSNLEADFARQDIDRASSALANEISALSRTNVDYSAWNATYSFLRGKNPNYPSTELPANTLGQLKVNFVVILNNSGREVFSRGYDLVTRREAPVPPDLRDYLKPGSLLAMHKKESSDIGGIIMLRSGPMLVDSQPVLTTSAEGPIMGSIIMGLALDSGEVVRLSAMTHLSIDLEGIDSVSSRLDSRFGATNGTRPNQVRIEAREKNSVAAYEELIDLDGKPALILRVRLPREIYRQGQTTLLQFLLLLLAAGSAFAAVTLYLLERTVLSRVANLSERVTFSDDFLREGARDDRPRDSLIHS